MHEAQYTRTCTETQADGSRNPTIFYSEVTGSTYLRGNVHYFNRQLSFDGSAQLMWVVVKMAYANMANKTTESDNR